MTGRRLHGGWVALIATKLVCCVGFMLLVTGVLTVNGIGTWLFGGGAIWLVLSGLAVTFFVFWRRQRTGGTLSSGRAGAADTD